MKKLAQSCCLFGETAAKRQFIN